MLVSQLKAVIFGTEDSGRAEEGRAGAAARGREGRRRSGGRSSRSARRSKRPSAAGRASPTSTTRRSRSTTDSDGDYDAGRVDDRRIRARALRHPVEPGRRRGSSASACSRSSRRRPSQATRPRERAVGACLDGDPVQGDGPDEDRGDVLGDGRRDGRRRRLGPEGLADGASPATETRRLRARGEGDRAGRDGDGVGLWDAARGGLVPKHRGKSTIVTPPPRRRRGDGRSREEAAVGAPRLRAVWAGFVHASSTSS